MISAVKLTTATATLLSFGCLFGYWARIFNEGLETEKRTISGVQIIFYTLTFPIFTFLFYFVLFCFIWMISIISSEYKNS